MAGREGGKEGQEKGGGGRGKAQIQAVLCASHAPAFGVHLAATPQPHELARRKIEIRISLLDKEHRVLALVQALLGDRPHARLDTAEDGLVGTVNSWVTFNSWARLTQCGLRLRGARNDAGYSSAALTGLVRPPASNCWP